MFDTNVGELAVSALGPAYATVCLYPVGCCCISTTTLAH